MACRPANRELAAFDDDLMIFLDDVADFLLGRAA